MRFVSSVTAAVLCGGILYGGVEYNNGVNGFSPVANKRHLSGGGGGVRYQKMNVMMATIDKKDDTMTSLDEDVLFGGSDPNDGSSSSSTSDNTHNSNAPFQSRQRHRSQMGNLLVDSTRPLNPLDHSTTDPLINKLRTIRETLPSCPALWSELGRLCPDRAAVVDEHCSDEALTYTFADMDRQVRRSAAAFRSLGVAPGDHVAILGENSARWLLADHGVQLLGGVSAVRGADAPLEELRYIYEHSDSKGIVVLQGPKLLKKLVQSGEEGNDEESNEAPLGLYNAAHGPVQTVILLNNERQSDEDVQSLVAHLPQLRVVSLTTLMNTLEPLSLADLPTLTRNDVSTIVYTSGTTGRPKGVVLRHGNLLHQIGHRLGPTRPYDETEPVPGDTMLSLLPVWHITERTFELWMFTRGCRVVYSSIRTFQKDLQTFTPEWMVLVPRVLEKVATGVQNKFNKGSVAVRTLVKLFTWSSTIKNKHSLTARGLVLGEKAGRLTRLKSRLLVWSLAPVNALGTKLVWSKVRAGFGGQQKLIISGGSALSGALESFYQRAGIPIVVGYGLTECAPLLSHRRSDANLIVPGCVGPPCLDTEVRVVEAGEEDYADTTTTLTQERPPLPDGTPGLVLGRGPQVMRGYYKNPTATARAVDPWGWFDTGDVGYVNPATGDLVLTGRAKDTIVLSNGENVEPTPIEDTILTACAPWVEQVMLCGQDGRSLTALVVLNPAETVRRGYVGDSDSQALARANERINDPTCTSEQYQEAREVLDRVTAQHDLRNHKQLNDDLLKEMRQAITAKKFRPWEQVTDVYVTLEPFAMINQLLTQSYKVKRDAVFQRYGDEL